MPHLLLQLENAKHERFSSRRAARDINVDWYDPVAATGDAVAVVVVSSSVGAAAHRNDPSGIGHLIIDLPKSRGHLVGQSTGNNHNIRLAG